MELVSVTLKDTTIAHDPVVGATVRFYDTLNTFITQAVTDALGKVSVLLPGAASPAGVVYYVRAYKPGCSFASPFSITVFEPALPAPDNNDFLMDVNIFEVANSTLPGICRVSGFLYGQDGKPLPNAMIRLVPYHGSPRVYYAGLVASIIETQSDDDGKVLFDAMCGGTYEVVVADRAELRRRVKIPERAGLLFGDLVYPIPVDVTFDPAGPYLVHVGVPFNLTPHVIGSDWNDWSDGGIYVDYKSDDLAILTLSRSGSVVVLTGNTPGTANVVVTRTDKAFRVVPDRVSSWTFPVVVAP